MTTPDPGHSEPTNNTESTSSQNTNGIDGSSLPSPEPMDQQIQAEVPAPDQPLPDLNQPAPDLNQLAPDLNQPAPDLNQPPPDLDQPPPELDQPPPDLDQPLQLEVDRPRPVQPTAPPQPVLILSLERAQLPPLQPVVVLPPLQNITATQQIPSQIPTEGASPAPVPVVPPSVPQRAVQRAGPVQRSNEKPEFELNDKQEKFELWSSDATSPEEDDDTEDITKKKVRQNWSDTVKKEAIKELKFTGQADITELDTTRKYSILECFKLFVDDDLIQMMVTETNKNARANFKRYGYHEGFLSGWIDVDFKEMTQFIGVIIFMAFKRLPETISYWSTERIYYNAVCCRVFTQTRFHRILAFWHFGTDGTDSVYAKINPLIDRLNANFKKYKQPGNILYVGKSTVYLRNKYIFESGYATKKGSKILKVMDHDVYTYKLKILSPETGATRTQQTKNNVMNLLDGFLGQGRLVIFHNLYISLDLAQELLKNECHSIGMIRKNARGTPKQLEHKSIKDGELIGYQNEMGLSVLKWQLLGAQYFGITTCHTLEFVTAGKKGKQNLDNFPSTTEEKVPEYLRDISLSEKVFDAHEKFSINTSPLNEQVKWYQRLACDAIVNIATTNALVLYKKINKDRMKMWDFRDKLFRELVDIKQLPSISSDEETEEPDLDDDE